MRATTGASRDRILSNQRHLKIVSGKQRVADGGKVFRKGIELLIC